MIQDKKDEKIVLFGLRSLNLLLSNEGNHSGILSTDQAKKNDKEKDEILEDEKKENEGLLENQAELSTLAANPIKILLKKFYETESTQILNETTKALKILSQNKVVIDMISNLESKFWVIIEDKPVETSFMSYFQSKFI